MRRAREAATRVGWWLAHVLGPLGVGGVLYIVARPQGLLFWSWADALSIRGALEGLRAAWGPLTADLPAWVAFTLPDALWVYALAAAIARLHRDSELRVRLAYLAVPLALGPGAELLQLAHLLPGTFDALDLVATVLAFGLASWRALPLVPDPAARRV